MKMVLVDTSVWIEVFRRPAAFDLESVVDFDDVVTCLPVIQEVLQGFREPFAYRRARQAMLALPIIESPLTAEVYHKAIELYRAARRTGVTVRSSVDCLIAACALRHHMTVLHRDRDFQTLSRVSLLNARDVMATKPA